MRKVLIANRGEIAVRIARTLREMGIATVAAYSTADRGALHVAACDEAIEIGPAPALESYLDIERLIAAARRTGADGLHPGYGFVAENPELPDACERANITFIGPPASAMRRMALKIEAREAMAAAGVPVVPGGSAKDVADARQTAARIGYPLILKPSAGGGGKGMRRVHDEGELEGAYERARSEAQNAFGDSTVYLEKLLEHARHVEVQLLGDRHGRVVHVYERDCSLQRRHQKIIEESPCPVLDEARAEELGRIAAQGAASIGYFSAGTMEFLLAPSGDIYFLEMNTRLQVEHPVTEMCTGLDLVEQMVRIARGEPLPFTVPPPRRGHALECRIYAEDPARGFLPSPGKITELRLPAGPGVRNDEGASAGQTIVPDYDPLIAKLIVHGATREQVLRRASRALGEYHVGGIATNLDFLRAIVTHEAFVHSRHHTRFLDDHLDSVLGSASAEALSPEDRARLLAALAARTHHDSKRSRQGLSPAASAQSAWILQHRASRGRGR
jgi:acetyl-CoA carboxylase biotin carboxylase subunit